MIDFDFASYLFKKLLFLFISLFLVATLTFFMMKAIPGNPFLQEQAVPEEILKSMFNHYGLNDPLLVQYIKYLKGIVTFDLGPSFKYEGRTVNDIISEGFPVSMILGLQALTLSFLSGITLGSIAAFFQNKWQDKASILFATIGISVPNFILASFLQYFLALKLDLFPVARWGDFSHTVLPTLALSALPTAFIARLVRSNMIEIMHQDYILTAKAKGLSSFRIMTKHIIKNSILPSITYLGPLSSQILTGSFIVERIFGIPGLGGWFVTSITNRDYTVIMGVTIFYSFILLVTVFVLDLLYPLLDPRIKIKTEAIYAK